MRRAHAILVIMALVAAPLALVARSLAASASDCNGYCCLTHGRHSHRSQTPPPKSPDDGMQCHQGESARAMDCSMRSGYTGMDFGLLAPIVPVTPSLLDRIAAPAASRRSFTSALSATTVGFRSTPFEPPRL
jgi:hypothetical protein